MPNFAFPFSAIVGQDAMKAALLLNAVDPSLGGVLIRGQKGTGKSTAARALAALLPELEAVTGCPYRCDPQAPQLLCDRCRERLERGEKLAVTRVPMPVVELPLSAGEDRVVGTVQLEHALQTGQRRFEPGLLAAANRGILYVDEVNLLEDHLVDLLLDAAASGVNRVEREGLCVSHPARFLLVGTMNPEEGELRPQFLDRFGLVVDVAGLAAPPLRRRLLENRLAFEQDPAAFCTGWRAEEDFLADQVLQARARLPRVAVPAAVLDQAVALALELQVHGHRADLALLKTARALAALLEQPAVGAAELREAAAFVLPHRLPGIAGGGAEEGRTVLAAALDRVLDGADARPRSPASREEELDNLDYLMVEAEFPGSAAAGSMLFLTLKKKLRSASSTSMTGSISSRSTSPV